MKEKDLGNLLAPCRCCLLTGTSLYTYSIPCDVHYPKQQQCDDFYVGFRELRHPDLLHTQPEGSGPRNQKKKNKPQGGAA